MDTTHEYVETRRVSYGDGACFVPVCAKCSRYVRAPETMTFDGRDQPMPGQVTCSKCGPTDMLWEGWIA